MEAGMSWTSWLSPEERRGAAREHKRMVEATLASADETLRRSEQREHGAVLQRTTAAPAGIIHKTKDNARVVPERPALKHSEPVRSAPTSTSTVANPDAIAEIWDWLREHTDGHKELVEQIAEGVVGLISERTNPLKREQALLRRELEILRTEVNIRGLQKEVAAAREQVPAFPAIEARLDAENRSLKAKLAGMERELEKTKDRLGKVRVNQSVTEYSLKKLEKQVEANGAASIEMEYESRHEYFQMRASHPDAARALKDFANGIIKSGKNVTLWVPPPTGNGRAS
jgi:hypothetical protein